MRLSEHTLGGAEKPVSISLASSRDGGRGTRQLKSMSLGTFWVPRPQDFLLSCDWVIVCARLEDDDCHHSLMAEPPLYVFSCGSQAHIWDALLATC